MKQSRLFSTSCSLLMLSMISSCSTMSTPVALNTNGSKAGDYRDANSSEYQKKIFASYCQQGRQVKKFAYNLRFVKPALPKKIPLDQAHALIQTISDIRECSIKTSAIQLSQHCAGYSNCHNFYKTSDSLLDVVNYAKEIIYNDKSTEFCRMGSCTESGPMKPAFVSVGEGQPIILIFEKTERRSRPGSFGWYVSKYGDDGSGPQAFFVELSALRQGYAVLFADSVAEEKWMDYTDQNGICYSDFHAKNGAYRNLASDFGADGATLSPAEALGKHEANWKRYILANQTIKEAPSTDTKIVNYEVSLDLNKFCKFGRPIDDLLSY